MCEAGGAAAAGVEAHFGETLGQKNVVKNVTKSVDILKSG